MRNEECKMVDSIKNVRYTQKRHKDMYDREAEESLMNRRLKENKE